MDPNSEVIVRRLFDCIASIMLRFECMTWPIMNFRGDSQLKIPRLEERIAILSHRQVEDSLPGKSDIIEKTILLEEQAVDHGIQPTKTRSEIETAKYPQKGRDCSANAFVKTCHEAPFAQIASQMTALLHKIKQTPPIA
jgi:hypothetical protein